MKSIKMLIPPDADTILEAPKDDAFLFVERMGGFLIPYKDHWFALIQTQWIMIRTPEGKDNENNSKR